MNPARLSTPPGRQPSHDGGGKLARVTLPSAGHFLFVPQSPQNVGADGTDISEPCIRHASPWVLRWAGAACIGWVHSRAKSLPLFSLKAQVNHFAHSMHSVVRATKSVRRMFRDAEKFSSIFGKSFREAGNDIG